MKKLLAIILTLTLTLAMLAGCSEPASSESGIESSGSDEQIELTVLCSKADIIPHFETLLDQYEQETGVKVTYKAVGEGQSPYQALQVEYASGNPPALALVDANDIVALGEEHGVPLDDESWVAEGGETYGVSVNGTLYGFPFSLEGRGLLYNKTAIEETLGKEFDPSTVTNIEEFQAVLDELVAAGMEKPVIVTKEDWSLGAHYLGLMYEQQDGTSEGADAFIDGLKNGENVGDNAVFNDLFDTFDILMEYNLNGEDPMAVNYDVDNANFATGEAAFWFNGNWVWPVVSEFADSESEFGMLPVFRSEGGEFNSLVNAVGSKQYMIDNSLSEEEIQAAKDFLNWHVYDEDVHTLMAENIQAVPAFTTFSASEANKLGVALNNYVVDGQTFPQYNGLPGDHWSVVGAYIQKYLAGDSTRDQLASDINGYWQGLA